MEGIISSPRELRKVFIMSGGIQAKTEKVRGVRVMGGVPQGEGQCKGSGAGGQACGQVGPGG